MSKKSEERAREELAFDLAELRHARSPQLWMPYDFSEGDRTVQDFRNECDINEIMARWERKQTVVHVNPNSPQYGDFCDVGEYLDALNRVKAAQQAFAALPSRIRDHVGNDPAALLEFASDPANADAWKALHMETPDSPKPDVPAKGVGAAGAGASGQPASAPTPPSAT